MKRRTWLLGAAGAAGALVVGWGVLPQRSRTVSGRLWPPAEGEVALNGWIKILPDGALVLAMPRSEMGQGVHTALSMLAAEALRYSQPANGACGHPQRSANGVLARGGALTQCFFSGSSVDEIAFELKQDPVALRRQRLTQARATWACWIWRPAGLSGAAPCRQGGPRVLHCMNRLAPSCRKSPRYLRLAASCRRTVSYVPLNAVWWSTRALLRSK